MKIIAHKNTQIKKFGCRDPPLPLLWDVKDSEVSTVTDTMCITLHTFLKSRFAAYSAGFLPGSCMATEGGGKRGKRGILQTRPGKRPLEDMLRGRKVRKWANVGFR